MKALLTNKAIDCKHTRMICGDCGSCVFTVKQKETFASKKFLALAMKVRKYLIMESGVENQ